MKTVKIILFLVISVVSLNFFTDPFDCRGQIFLYEKPRDFIYDIIYINRHQKYDYVLVSSSSAFLLLNQKYFNSYTGKTIAHLCIQKLPLESEYHLLKYFLDLHPETKNVIIAMEKPQFSDCAEPEDYILPKKQPDNFNSYINIYFSWSAVKSSFLKLKELFTNYYDKNIDKKENVFYLMFPKRMFLTDNLCIENNAEYYRQITEMCQNRGVNVISFMIPAHVNFLVQAHKNSYYHNIESLKRHCASVMPFHDMLFVSKYTTTPLYYWYDMIHPWSYIEDDVIDVIINKKSNSDLSVTIDKNNVDKVLAEQKIALKRYLKDNKNKNLPAANYEHEEQEKAVKIYMRDLPKNIFEKYSDNFFLY